MNSTPDNLKARLIAFYLPQFHPIPENDAWWGKGFTEWTNVAKATPLFKGHYQPHIPAEMGYYDLRLPEVRLAQANLAREFGIHGFCYYHYWFNGLKILDRPIKEVLNSGEPDFPFCLCWANENWTRIWDGGNDQILLAQNYNHVDDKIHIRQLLKTFEDKRYIRINGKPLFLVYRTELLPSPARTAEIWREEAHKAGVGELFLARVESKEGNINPTNIGFDAAVEFSPDWRNLGGRTLKTVLWRIYCRLGLKQNNYLYDYNSMIESMISKKDPGYIFFRCVCPSFDNSPRRKSNSAIFYNSTPDLYKKWLSAMIKYTMQKSPMDNKIIFVNAWNEWGEGNHLEPDQKWGQAYLQATKNALEEVCINQQ